MKITFLAICCFAVVLSTYAAPQSSPNNPQTGNQNPKKDPAKPSQNNPSKGSQNNGNKGQQGANNKNNGQNKKGSKKVGNSQQLPPKGYNGEGNNGQNFNQDKVDVKKTYSARTGQSPFFK